MNKTQKRRGWSQDEIWPWLKKEEEDLTYLYGMKQYGFNEICDILNRSRGSVSGKARKMGLRRKQND